MTTKYYNHRNGFIFNVKYVKCVDGNYFWVFKTGGACPIKGLSKEQSDGFVQKGIWVEFAPKLRNRRKTVSETKYVVMANPSHEADKHWFIEVKDGKATYFSPNYSCDYPLDVVEWETKNGCWIYVSKEVAEKTLKKTPQVRYFRSAKYAWPITDYVEWSEKEIVCVCLEGGERKPFVGGLESIEARLKDGSWKEVTFAEIFEPLKKFTIRQTKDFEVEAKTPEEALQIARNQVGKIWKLGIV